MRALANILMKTQFAWSSGLSAPQLASRRLICGCASSMQVTGACSKSSPSHRKGPSA